jgi:hypothetical protein
LWAADDTKAPNSRPIDPRTPELMLHYDFYVQDGDRVSDASGKKHDGKLVGGTIVPGLRRPAIAFEGKGLILLDEKNDDTNALNFVSHTLSIGARCKPTSADGVIISVGDDTNGLSLYIKNGIPHFAVRSAGKLVTVAGTDPVKMDQWVHLFGTIDAQGNVSLVSNGWPAAQAKGSLLDAAPTEPLCVGADDGAPVGDYTGPMPWYGLLDSVRLYWGVITRAKDSDELGDWAQLPGCGCRK